MTYRNKRTGQCITVNANCTRQQGLNDFWTDSGFGKFITGLSQRISRTTLPTVQTDVTLAPETQQALDSLQRSVLYAGIAIGGGIFLSKLLK